VWPAGYALFADLSIAGFVRQKRGKKVPYFIQWEVASSSAFFCLTNPAQIGSFYSITVRLAGAKNARNPRPGLIVSVARCKNKFTLAKSQCGLYFEIANGWRVTAFKGTIVKIRCWRFLVAVSFKPTFFVTMTLWFEVLRVPNKMWKFEPCLSRVQLQNKTKRFCHDFSINTILYKIA
jgi:hypothetical protein